MTSENHGNGTLQRHPLPRVRICKQAEYQPTTHRTLVDRWGSFGGFKSHRSNFSSVIINIILVILKVSDNSVWLVIYIRWNESIVLIVFYMSSCMNHIWLRICRGTSSNNTGSWVSRICVSLPVSIGGRKIGPYWKSPIMPAHTLHENVCWCRDSIIPCGFSYDHRWLLINHRIVWKICFVCEKYGHIKIWKSTLLQIPLSKNYSW